MSSRPAPAPGPDISISPDELIKITRLIYRWTGMTFGENKRYYIERRIADRMAKTGHADARSYLAFVSGDLAEREALINAFTINETYFYREEHQFAALARQILPAVVENRRPGDRIRIWSMPCSTGEEAYSIAIWLLENWRMVDAYNVEIVGSDIDSHALAAAAAGEYGDRALSRLPTPVLESYFRPTRHHRRQIIDDLRESVSLSPANLIDRASMADHGRFEVIFCRNVLIYFDDAARKVAVGHLFDALVPGGFLCLGHTESMSRISDAFELRRFPDAMVYQRPV